MTILNFKYVLKLLGVLILALSLTMVLPLLWTLLGMDWRFTSEALITLKAILQSMGVGAAIGLVSFLYGRNCMPILGKREAMLLVSLSWFVGSVVAALPFWIWANNHPLEAGTDRAFLRFVNCYFEAISGLTTTGSTVLSNIESIPQGLLLWRSLTHWLGGLGIVVIFVALFPSYGGGSKRLFSVEATGLSSESGTPHVQETARILLFIYISFTALQIVFMKLADPSLSWFHSINHAFATLATGGYSTFNGSAGDLKPIVQWIIIAFMFLAGVNFGLYQQLLRRNWRQVFANSELKFYVLVIAVSFLIIFISIYGTSYDLTTGDPAPQTFSQGARDALFQTISIQTTTGFCSVNFEHWPIVAKSTLIILMMIGGCGGSTGGGIKVIRILSMLKIIFAEIEKSFRPNVVRSIRVGSTSLSDQQKLGVVTYILSILGISGLGACLLMLTESKISGTTALTATLSAINNIGPGLERVGAIENYEWFSDSGKWLLSLLMAIGRLEIFAVVAIFSPQFWKTD